MFTFHDLLRNFDINPKQVKLVRHSNAEYKVLDLYRQNVDKFEAYQSFQKPRKFAKANHIAVFVPLMGTTSLFLGLWNISATVRTGDLGNELHSLIDKYVFPHHWHDDHEWYDLERNQVFDDLSERLVIDWGKGTRSWVQTKDKPIVEIKGANSIGDFVSYDQVRLTYHDLKKLVSHDDSNRTFFTALRAINGIYLIRDKSTGGLYVGSAYGADGIFGRWATYAKNGHGGNKNLKILNPNNFEFSVLEIVPPLTSSEEVVRREMRWQEILGTRDFGGLNRK